MKVLFLFALVLLTVSCGKDNKTGDTPETLLPLLPYTVEDIRTRLVGHWVELGACHPVPREESHERGEPRRRGGVVHGLKQRFEMRFFEAVAENDFSAGTVDYGPAQYEGDCGLSPSNRRLRKRSPYRIARSSGLEIVNAKTGRFAKQTLEIKGTDRIEFDGKILVRISTNPAD